MEARPECKFSVNCYRRNPSHFIEFSHPYAEEIAEKINSGDIDHVISLNLSPAIIEQAQHLAELITNNELQLPQLCDKTATKGVKRTRVEVPLRNQNHGSKEIQFDDEVIELPSCSSSKKLKGDQMPQVKELETVVIGISVKDDKPPSKVSVADKIELSSPFNFFLSSITAVEDTQSQALSLKFSDIFDPSLGKLKESVQINFMVELGWLLAQYCHHRVQ